MRYVYNCSLVWPVQVLAEYIAEVVEDDIEAYVDTPLPWGGGPIGWQLSNSIGLCLCWKPLDIAIRERMLVVPRVCAHWPIDGCDTKDKTRHLSVPDPRCSNSCYRNATEYRNRT